MEEVVEGLAEAAVAAIDGGRANPALLESNRTGVNGDGVRLLMFASPKSHPNRSPMPVGSQRRSYLTQGAKVVGFFKALRDIIWITAKMAWPPASGPFPRAASPCPPDGGTAKPAAARPPPSSRPHSGKSIVLADDPGRSSRESLAHQVVVVPGRADKEGEIGAAEEVRRRVEPRLAGRAESTAQPVVAAGHVAERRAALATART